MLHNVYCNQTVWTCWTTKNPHCSISDRARIPSGLTTIIDSLLLLLCFYILFKIATNIFNPSSKPTDTPNSLETLLPPSRRYFLENLNVTANWKRKTEPNAACILANQVPLTAPWDNDKLYTPTGLSVQEIIAVGRFPDYAALSGVRLPIPHTNFHLDTAVARPYRPLRWPYHQTMSLLKLEADWWLEIDKNYRNLIQQRCRFYAQYGKSILDYLPGSEMACRELMEMVLQFLCARYPDHFELDKIQTTFINKILNTTTNLTIVHPLHVLLNNVPEDFALMQRHPETGEYFFRAGIICSSVGWSLGEKMGMRLDDIHEPVPHYSEKMRFSMNRYFAKLPTNNPIQRGSWTIELDTPLYIDPLDPLADKPSLGIHDPSIDPARYHFRVDWQTLRRLPLSGAVAFNFKALFTPLLELEREPYVPALVLKMFREREKHALLPYKSLGYAEGNVVPVLEGLVRRQVERGMVEGDWDVGTLGEYPFYPGWDKNREER